MSKKTQKTGKNKEETKSQVRARYAKQVMEKHQNRRELVTNKSNMRRNLNLSGIRPNKNYIKNEDLNNKIKEAGKINSSMRNDEEIDHKFTPQARYLLFLSIIVILFKEETGQIISHRTEIKTILTPSHQPQK